MKKIIRKAEERWNKVRKDKLEETARLHKWFTQIWDEREDEYGYCYCFETGAPMHRSQYRMLSTVYDHVLEKSAYKQYKYVKRNIVIILPEVHSQKGSDISKTPKIMAYRDDLLLLHDSGNLND